MNDESNTSFDFGLAPSEHLVWSGRPPRGLLLRASDVFLIPLTTIAGVFGIFWEVNAITSGAGWGFLIAGILPLTTGLYGMFGRFWFDAKLREHTRYAVTNERVIVSSGFFQPSVKSLDIDTLKVTLKEQANGFGTIYTVGPYDISMTYSRAFPFPGMTDYLPPCFELIDNAREVYELIRMVQRESRAQEVQGSLAQAGVRL